MANGKLPWRLFVRGAMAEIRDADGNMIGVVTADVAPTMRETVNHPDIGKAYHFARISRVALMRLEDAIEDLRQKRKRVGRLNATERRTLKSAESAYDAVQQANIWLNRTETKLRRSRNG